MSGTPEQAHRGAADSAARAALATAVSWLFVPANRPERIAKAVRSGAHAVVVDLEDSVPAADKADARDRIRQASPADAGVPVVIRVNGSHTAQITGDLALARELAPAAVVLPKAGSVEEIHAAARASGVGVAGGRNGVHGPVAVGLPTTVAAQPAPALFSWTKASYPGIHLQLFESMSGYIHELLLAGRLDLAAVFREDDAPRAAELPLCAEELHLVGQPRPVLPAHHEVPLGDLRTVPLVTPGGRSNLRTLVDRAFAAQGMTPDNVADVESLGTLIRIAESGEACTILPRSVVATHPDPEALGVRRIVSPTLRRHIAVRTATDRYEPRAAVAAVREGVAEVTRTLAAEGRWAGIDLHED